MTLKVKRPLGERRHSRSATAPIRRSDSGRSRGPSERSKVRNVKESGSFSAVAAGACVEERSLQGERKNMARTYAGVVGVVIILIGVVGLLAGEEPLLGLVNIDIVEDLVHLLTGGLLAYVGFGQRDEGLARNVVGGLGVVYLVVGVLGFVVPMLLGLIPHGFSVVDNIIHLALGVAGLAVAFSSRDGAPARVS